MQTGDECQHEGQHESKALRMEPEKKQPAQVLLPAAPSLFLLPLVKLEARVEETRGQRKKGNNAWTSCVC